MLSAHSDQHSSTLEEEDPAVHNIPRSINLLEQYLAQAKTKLDHLNSLTIPHAELTTDFALPRTTELEAEKNRIRSSDLAHTRQLAESYLMRFKDAERRNTQLSQRTNALEGRIMMAESICSEQMQINREIGEESLKCLRQFSELERKRISIVKTANNRTESLTREINRVRSQCEQQEQSIGRLRAQIDSHAQENSSLAQQLNRAQSDKSTLLLERDRFAHEIEALRAQLTEREDLIEDLRDRELRTAAELRDRDALIETLGEERDRRDQELVRSRREFQNLLAEKERDMEKLLETKRKEVTAELKTSHRADIERYQQAIRQQRKDFEEALQEALRETQKLAAQREEYFNNWRRLEAEQEMHKRKLNALISRKMVSKCTELVRDLKDIGFENGHVPSTPRTLEPVENVAQRILDGMASQRERESGFS